jgi:F-type H+-transporting ATPase subunit b
MKTSIIEKAHEEAKLIIQNAREEIESEKEMIMTDIREKTVELSIKLAERILEDNIDESKNDKMARDFLKGLE